MFSSYKGKRIFVTGHSGFKGGWLSLWLKILGAEVLGYSLEPDTNPSFFKAIGLENKINSAFADILDYEKLNQVMNDFKPEIVFHLAAQPLVRKSYYEPILTYKTNVIGTLNVLEAARNCESVKAFVNITSDKCYENKELSCAYCEDDSMGGHDMYSSSKACAEIMSSSYRKSFLEDKSYLLATARAGNVIGGGDWSEDRLIPDCVRAVESNQAVKIRNPFAVRPWQFVLEPLSGYLVLGEKLLSGKKDFAQAFNFGPERESILTVEQITKLVIKEYLKGEIIIENAADLHESKLLMLDSQKSKNVLEWSPLYNINEAVSKTVEWYKRFYKGEDISDFSMGQIQEYQRVKEGLSGKSAQTVS